MAATDDLDRAVEAALGSSLKPYDERFEEHTRIPQHGIPRPDLLDQVRAMSAVERPTWQDGYASGAVYHGEQEHIDFLAEVYKLTSQANPLHPDLWPSVTKYEAEVIAMTATMLGAEHASEPVAGVIASGGTESILLAMKTYRDWAREQRGITAPEMVVPGCAHAAFDKASHYFDIKKVTVPVDGDFRADVEAMRQAITPNTIVVAASAPCFPHGIIDPIEDLSEVAREAGVPFHTDACLGGFLLPWAQRLGYPVPAFDFRLSGVTSMSADTHKFGYAAKGTSVILYRGLELRRHQYYKTATWSGGLYSTPTFSGSRPGALSAAAWAALLSLGEDGYLEGARRILEAAATIKQGIESIEGLDVLGDPLWVIAFAAEEFDIYAVLDLMAGRGWSLNGLLDPAAIHICVTLRHTQPGVAGRFVADLTAATEHARRHPQQGGGLAPIYGMASSVGTQGVVEDILERYLDLLYRV